MTLNCKPGDLAIITSARRTPENIGCIVEVLRPAAHLETFEAVDGGNLRIDTGSEHIWRVRSGRPLMWRTPLGIAPLFIELPVGDSNLRPISGVALDDETPIETKLPDPLFLALGIEARSYT